MDEFLQFEDYLWSREWPLRIRFKVFREGREPRQGFIYFRKYRAEDIGATLRELLESAGENSVLVRLERYCGVE